MTVEERELLEELISSKGRDHQQIIAMGEMAELIEALSKMLRGNGDEWKVIDEIADVGIVLDQLRLMYDPTGEREDLYRYFKLNRVAQRNIEGGQP